MANKTISISQETYDRIKKLAHPGQIIDGILTEMLDKIDWVERNKAPPTAPETIQPNEQQKNI